MKSIKLISLLLICGVMATWHTQAQDVTVDVLERSVTSYTSQMNTALKDASYYENMHRFNTNYPSIKYNSSLQVGAGAPGLILGFLLYDFGYDESSIHRPPQNFSGELADVRYYQTPTVVIPVLSIEYVHNVKRWLALGVKGVVGFETNAERHVGSNRLFSRNSNVITSALFNMRFSWLHRNIVSMYSSLGVGVTFNSTTSGYREALPMVDVTWVGIHVGKRVYGFAEFGGFIGGVLRGGVGVRF